MCVMGSEMESVKRRGDERVKCESRCKEVQRVRGCERVTHKHNDRKKEKRGNVDYEEEMRTEPGERERETE